MNERRFLWLVWALAVPCALLLAFEAAWALRAALDDPWNDARLGPTAAMLRGVPLWTSHGEAPLLTRVYGPVGVAFWLPAVLQATPTRAILVGLVEALLVALGPVAWLVGSESRRHVSLALAALLLGVAYVLSTPVLPDFSIHVDAPALGLSTIALACAWTERRRQHAGWRTAGALAVVAAVLTKQVMVPLLVAWPAWFVVASGLRVARRAAFALAAVALVSVMVLLPLVDVDAMWFSLVTGPSRQPWQDADPIAALARVSWDLTRRSLPALALLAVAATLAWRPGATWRDVARANRWLFPLLVGVVCVPTAMAGRIKAGGSANALAPTIWFVWLAMTVALASASRRGANARRSATLLALGAAVLLALRLAPAAASLPTLLRASPLPSVAFEAARLAPGTIYFPSRSLINLMADGRADHFNPAIRARELEGQPVDDRLFRDYLPPALDRIAIDQRSLPDAAVRLPRFRRQIIDASLPGWIVLTRDEVVSAGDWRAWPVHADPHVSNDVLSDLPVTRLGAPDGPARLESARVTIVDRQRRYRVGLEIATAATTATQLELEVFLLDAEARHLVTLAGAAEPDAGRVVLEWPVLDDFIRPAARALVVIRGGLHPSGAGWRLPDAEVRSLIRQ